MMKIGFQFCLKNLRSYILKGTLKGQQCYTVYLWMLVSGTIKIVCMSGVMSLRFLSIHNDIDLYYWIKSFSLLDFLHLLGHVLRGHEVKEAVVHTYLHLWEQL